jgi:hypothetical protein
LPLMHLMYRRVLIGMGEEFQFEFLSFS